MANRSLSTTWPCASNRQQPRMRLANTVTWEAGQGMPCPHDLNTDHVSMIRKTQ